MCCIHMARPSCRSLDYSAPYVARSHSLVPMTSAPSGRAAGRRLAARAGQVFFALVAPFMTWLAPAAGPERDRLAATIDRLAAEHGGPRFQPHVTVAATVDSAADAAVHRLTSLVAEVPPIELTFAVIGHEQAYFRALYLRAEPSAPLRALQEAAQRAWALDPLAAVPDLSLLYAEIPEDRKGSIIDGLGIALPLTVRFDAVELWMRDPRGVRSWRRHARVPLAGVPDAEGIAQT